jgi:HSF-type DNA-binding
MNRSPPPATSNNNNNNNVRVGTLAEATGANESNNNTPNNSNSNGNNKNDKSNDTQYIYRDFAQLVEEEFDVDYEIEQEGLNLALEEATAVAATQLLSSSPYNHHLMHNNSAYTNRIVRANGWCRSQRFPVKLYALLSQPQLAHIITWMPHGRSWKVLKPKEFEAHILPGTSYQDGQLSLQRMCKWWMGPERSNLAFFWYHVSLF